MRRVVPAMLAAALATSFALAQSGAPRSGDESIAYGADARQAIDFHRAADPTVRPPLVLFVHGGGWQFGNRTRAAGEKPQHFVAAGYAFASTGYRLLPDAPVEVQAQDVAAALVRLRAQADALGFDPDRVVLMGHSAGAHLAALVATDPRYAGDAMRAIRAVVLLDGAGYDVPATMASRGTRARRVYDRAFGNDPARQTTLSPVTHVGAPDAPSWLILHVADRGESRAQSQALAERLRAAGSDAAVVAVPGTDHGRLNRDLGTPGDFATNRVDAFLATLFD